MPAKKPTMRENISSRPTDSSGRRATDADLGIGPGVAAIRKAAAKEIMRREGTTSPAGGRAAAGAGAAAASAAAARAAPKIKPMPKIKPTPAPKMSKPVQVIRTTQMYKPTPTAKKR
jgi:hypothetical protein